MAVVFKSIKVFKFALLASALVLGPLGVQSVFAQAGTDRAVFQEEQQMMQMDQNQERNLEQQKQSYEQQIQAEEQQRQPYRLYAEKRIQELTKLKSAGGSPTRSLSQNSNSELYALEKWMSSDEAARVQEQAHISQLDQAIANLQQAQNTTMSNMNSDVQAMREDSQRQAEAQKFQQQMDINHFNELQSEMGAASWGRPPTDGTFNSVGGRYGIGGGYGYNALGRVGGY